MIPMQATFDIEPYLPGLLKGDYVRVGGVITKAPGTPSGGEIVGWLREISASPLPTNQLISNTNIASLLGMIGNVTSILNLGATIVFGSAILSKLGKIERKIDRLQWTMDIIKRKIDRLQWTVELGFASTLRYLETLTQFETLGDAKAAAELAWGAQLLEPNSHKRITRITQALGHITSASQKTMILIKSEMAQTIERFKRRYPRQRLSINPTTLSVLERFRFACSVVALKAAIYAEDDELESAVNNLKEETRTLEELINTLGYTFLRGESPGDFIYDDLLCRKWKDVISPERIEAWAKRFDPEIKNIYEILEFLRNWSKLTRIDQSFSGELTKNLPAFADLLDGAYEDVQRLKGRVIEYNYAIEHKLSISEYREMLKVNDVPKDTNLVIIKPKSITDETEKTRR